MCARKRRLEDDERQNIPNVLQGEVARLDPKFLVNLDPSHCSNNGTVHLICKLGECPLLPAAPRALIRGWVSACTPGCRAWGQVSAAALRVTDDKELPSVPPLEVSVPADYPAQSPLWIDQQWQYGA